MRFLCAHPIVQHVECSGHSVDSFDFPPIFLLLQVESPNQNGGKGCQGGTIGVGDNNGGFWEGATPWERDTTPQFS